MFISWIISKFHEHFTFHALSHKRQHISMSRWKYFDCRELQSSRCILVDLEILGTTIRMIFKYIGINLWKPWWFIYFWLLFLSSVWVCCMVYSNGRCQCIISITNFTERQTHCKINCHMIRYNMFLYSTDIRHL